MFARLFILFVTVPLVELYVLFKLSEWTKSPALTVGLVLLTGFLGAFLAKRQGLSVVSRIQGALAAGRMPSTELMDGAMILVAGALLLTPGLLTDLFGFSLLFPPCRQLYRAYLARFAGRIQWQSFHVQGRSGDTRESRGSHFSPGGDVVDGWAEPSRDAPSGPDQLSQDD